METETESEAVRSRRAAFPERARRDLERALAKTLTASERLRKAARGGSASRLANLASRLESASGALSMHAHRVAESSRR